MLADTPLSSLRPAPWNPRTIKDERFQNLVRSIEADPDFLRLRPVLATADGTIYAGNMRYRAAEHLKFATVPAILEDIPEQLAKERALRDNQQWGEWHDDELAELLYGLNEQGSALDLLGFEQKEIDRLLASVGVGGGLTDEDAVPETPEEPVTNPGDLWLLGEHRLLCGDSTDAEDVLRLMDGQRAPLMATDPPYLVDYQGGNHPPSWSNLAEVKDKHWDDYKDPAASVEFFERFLKVALEHALTAAPAVYQWHAAKRAALVEEAWTRSGLFVHQQIIWAKARAVLTRSHFMWQHEPCFYGWVEKKMPGRKPLKNATTVWQIDQKGESDGIHPTQKPVKIFTRPLEYHTKDGDICYEPFCGSGSQLIAAEMLRRRCYAMEIEPAFCDVIVKRWEDYTGKTAVLEERKVDS